MSTRISLVDLETTGLDATMHEIIEMGVVVFDKTTLEILATLDLRVLPEHLDRASPRALEINGYTPKGWKEAVPLSEAMTRFALVTVGSQFLAQNVVFDWAFIQEASRTTNIPLALERPTLDLPSIAWGKIPHTKVQSWSLKTLATYLGVPPEPKVHRALNGALCGYEVYKALMKL